MKKRNPRHGSMQFWPRVKAKRPQARIRQWAKGSGLLAFAGYKVGMTHVIANDKKTKSTVSIPATIIECPPLKAFSIRFYSNADPSSQIFAQNLDKELGRRISLPKKKLDQKENKDFDFITLLVHTQPKLTGIGKKKPEVFEIAIGGSKEEQMTYAKEKLGKDIIVSDILKEGQLLDIHSITKGKGFQGPVKRFGVTLRSHKSEKARRNPGSLGGWKAQGHVMYRVAHAGQMGFHQRTEHNKQVLKMGTEAKDIAQNGGFVRYGEIKNPYVLVKGSVGGAKKRLIKLTHATRPNHRMTNLPMITHISTVSKQ